MVNSRQKGKRGELEIVHIVKAAGFDARRGQQFSGGGDSPDVVWPFPLHPEVKFVESLHLYKAYEQAVRDADTKEPCVIHRKKKTKWLVTLDFNYFLDMLKRLN